MSDRTKRKTFIAIVFCLIILSVFSGCMYEREYYNDICVPLRAHKAEIIIKEWSFLQGSGAEIYYKDNEKEVLLGQLQGGDDGFCPFKEGLYSVENDDSTVTIEWCRFPSNKEMPWAKEIFELPHKHRVTVLCVT